MESYKNLGGNSGVRYFEIGNDYIIVRFDDGGTYLYNYTSTGRLNIEKMKSLATQGFGLNSFISKIVRKNYASKLK